LNKALNPAALLKHPFPQLTYAVKRDALQDSQTFSGWDKLSNTLALNQLPYKNTLPIFLATVISKYSGIRGIKPSSDSTLCHSEKAEKLRASDARH
jgi:hypothetical protein